MGGFDDGWMEGEGPAVAQEYPQDIDTSTGEGDDGLDVLAALGRFKEHDGEEGGRP
ncbi:hypothetical protein [Streptomyces sp. NPDC094468]|uniref:hypothetical protein n=1 Tax=Streptomyces sp. NPDC094468 TaxID=3366066 RepID=UPI0038063D31